MRDKVLGVVLGGVAIGISVLATGQEALAQRYTTTTTYCKTVRRTVYPVSSRSVIYRSSQRPVIVERPVYVERVVSRPTVVERIVERPMVAHRYHHGLIPTVYNFVFGG